MTIRAEAGSRWPTGPPLSGAEPGDGRRLSGGQHWRLQPDRLHRSGRVKSPAAKASPAPVVSDRGPRTSAGTSMQAPSDRYTWAGRPPRFTTMVRAGRRPPSKRRPSMPGRLATRCQADRAAHVGRAASLASFNGDSAETAGWQYLGRNQSHPVQGSPPRPPWAG